MSDTTPPETPAPDRAAKIVPNYKARKALPTLRFGRYLLNLTADEAARLTAFRDAYGAQSAAAPDAPAWTGFVGALCDHADRVDPAGAGMRIVPAAHRKPTDVLTIGRLAIPVSPEEAARLLGRFEWHIAKRGVVFGFVAGLRLPDPPAAPAPEPEETADAS